MIPVDPIPHAPAPAPPPSPGPVIGAIVVARMASRRLPGKALADLAGQPLLLRVVDLCLQIPGLQHRVLVATSETHADDPIALLCQRTGIPCFRGAPLNVAHRLLAAARLARFDAFFRVNADSPLLDPALLHTAAQRFLASPCDLVTNLRPRSYPYGVSAELIRTAALARAYEAFELPAHFEHVTTYLYENSATYHILNLPPLPEDLSRFRLTIDTPSDLSFLRRFFAHARDHSLPTRFEEAVAFAQSAELIPVP